jgi:hypothetical protein
MKLYRKLFLITFLIVGLFFVHKSVAAAPFEITSFDVSPKIGTLPQAFNFTFKLKYNGGAPAVCQPTAQNKYNLVWAVVYGVDYDSSFLGLVRTRKIQLFDIGTANLDFTETIPSNNVTTPPTGSKKLSFVVEVGCERVPGEGVQMQAVSTNQVCFTGTSGGNCDFSSAGSTQTGSFEIPNPLKGGASDFTSLVKIIAQWIFNLAIPIAVAMIVYAGILFLTAAGEPAKVTKAKDVLKYAVIGLAIIMIGSGFVTLIKSILELGGTP